LAGNLTLAEADPDVHATGLAVRNVTPVLGLDVNLHDVALETLAARSTCPPEDGRYAGDAVNDWMDGGGVGATVTVTGVAGTFPPPLTTSLNV
jgi:hypothetical protein